MKQLLVPLLSLGLATLAVAAEDKRETPQRVKHQITGLFASEREEDLRTAFRNIAEIKLVAIDFPNAEATLEYVPAKVFRDAKPNERIARLDQLLKSASNHTFGVKPLRSIPREKLRRIEIPVAGLDCKACCLAAYEAVYKLDGVETVTASFREGHVIAWIDPDKTNRSRLEAALKACGVEVKAR
jgi:copper chaperone CopZ